MPEVLLTNDLPGSRQLGSTFQCAFKRTSMYTNAFDATGRESSSRSTPKLTNPVYWDPPDWTCFWLTFHQSLKKKLKNSQPQQFFLVFSLNHAHFHAFRILSWWKCKVMIMQGNFHTYRRSFCWFGLWILISSNFLLLPSGLPSINRWSRSRSDVTSCSITILFLRNSA